MTEGATLVGEGSAPGKLFLTGEYAVLEGAPAILVPVRQRALARLLPAAKGEGVLRLWADKFHALPASALGEAPLVQAVLEAAKGALATGSAEGAALGAPAALSQSRVPQGGVDGIAQAGGSERLAALLAGEATLETDTSAFYKSGRKLGLGSSAAVTVALLRCLCPELGREALLPLAQQAHRRFQGGQGSGADVALAAYGEPIIFARDQPVQPASLPSGLALLFIWTSNPSSSRVLLEQLAQRRQANPGLYDQAMQRLVAAARDAAGALSQGAEDFTAAVQRYDASLLQFSDFTGLGFYSVSHRTMRNTVEYLGCVYKPSGAGGGDFGIAFASRAEPVYDLKARLDRAGVMNFLYQPPAQHTES